MTRRSSGKLLLTERALQDVQQIADYSTEHWGKKSADKYLDEIEAGIERLRSQPNLLQSLPDLHTALQFYRVNKHLIICDARPGSIIVLTVLHSSMDIAARLAKLQPTIAAEVEVLHQRLRAK